MTVQELIDELSKFDLEMVVKYQSDIGQHDTTDIYIEFDSYTKKYVVILDGGL